MGGWLQHHTRWEDWGPENTDVRTALLSNCIFLADRVDAFLQLRRSADVLLLRKETCETVNVLRGAFFAPELVHAFHGAAAREALWLTLEPHHVERYVAHVVRETRPVWIGLPEMCNLATIFGRVVDAKSPHTAGHSAGVARLAKLLARFHDLPNEEGDLLEVAGQLHDLGRLRVPDEVLDKPSALTEAELARVQRRVFETRQVLERIGGLDPIADWVGDHPSLLAGEVEADQVALPARILAVADVFQAMLQDRPQRKALTVREAVATMRRMARAGRLDAEVVDVLASQAEACRVAAVEGGGTAQVGAVAEA